jgi:hypothetical protein
MKKIHQREATTWRANQRDTTRHLLLAERKTPRCELAHVAGERLCTQNMQNVLNDLGNRLEKHAQQIAKANICVRRSRIDADV